MRGDPEALTPSPLLDLEQLQCAAVPVLDLDTVKAHLRVDGSSEDALIKIYMDTVEDYLDGYSGFLGRALVEQQWALYLDRFPWPGWAWPQIIRREARELMLPLTPLIAVDAVTYADPGGNPQTLDPSTYVVRTGPRGSIALRQGRAWPETDRDPRNVQIVFRSGFAPVCADTGVPDPTDVPARIRNAMLLMIGDLYDNRTTVVIAESRVTQILNPTADRLLATLRAAWF